MGNGMTFAAVDLGAESGRVVLATLEDGRLDLESIHRFANQPVLTPDGLHWDILRIYQEIKDGLTRAVACSPSELASVGIDSWAVDFGLLTRERQLLGNPSHYRDARTEGMLERALSRVSREDIYNVTGIQFMPINTLYQLLAMEGSDVLGAADRLLMIPDLLVYWLTGEERCEYTNATTTQLFDPRKHDWAWDLISTMGIPKRLFQSVTEPGKMIGGMLASVADETGVRPNLRVASVASHDTASAVVAVPASTGNFAYISSGTWSLVGVETSGPVLSEAAMRANFTNEGGFAGTNRFLKNVMGLWLLQECRRTWEKRGRDVPYEAIGEIVASVPPFGPLVDPDHESFLRPGDMPARIRDYCAATEQRVPETEPEIARCVFESLAVKYRLVLEQASEVSGQDIEVVHIVGGGARNAVLCQLTADATGLPVMAGPSEATAMGNALVQAYARGCVSSLSDIRAVVRNSVDIREYVPSGQTDEWDDMADRFRLLVNKYERRNAE